MPEETKTIWSQLISWGAGQPFNNVLLLLCLASFAWCANFTVTIAIPMHLKQIQEGYQSIDSSHRKEREEALRMYDKWMDRIGSHPRDSPGPSIIARP